MLRIGPGTVPDDNTITLEDYPTDSFMVSVSERTCFHIKYSFSFFPSVDFLIISRNVQFQKISILPPLKALEFPGGWGVL